MNGEPNYNLLALSAMMHPSGARLVGALASAQLMRQRQAELDRQKALEGQLSTITGFETNPDPEAGLTGLEGYQPPPDLRPGAAPFIERARGSLTKRAAARAAARARVQEAPGVPATTQEVPFSPDRAERGGAVPPTRFSDADLQTAEAANMPASDLPGGMSRAFPVAPSELSGYRAGTAAEANISPAVPPTMRPPRTEEELREALSDRERQLYYEATNFKGTPPDLAAMQTQAKTTSAENATALDAMTQDLDEWESSIAPEDRSPEQVAMAKRARRAITVARTNPRAISNAFSAVKDAVSGVTKGQTTRATLQFRKEVFANHQQEFQSTLTRIDQMIKNQNFANLDRELDNARSLEARMSKIMEEMLTDPATAPLVPTMKQEWLQLVGRLQHLQNLQAERRNAPLPTPPTGRGPEAPKNPLGQPAPAALPSKQTIRLKSGKVVEVE